MILYIPFLFYHVLGITLTEFFDTATHTRALLMKIDSVESTEQLIFVLLVDHMWVWLIAPLVDKVIDHHVLP